MLSHKTSVHFVNAEGHGNKMMLVPTFVLLYWKKFLLIIGFVMTILLVIIGIFIYQKTSQHYQAQLERANYVRKQIDLQKLQQSFKSIDESINKVNQFMTARGLHSLKMKKIDQNALMMQDVNKMSALYQKNIQKLEENVVLIPLGKPYEGKITSHFGTRANPFTGHGSEGHSGTDFRGKMGDPIMSTAEGKVSFAGQKGGYGNCIIIDHGFNLQTLYGHLSKINVKVGDSIKGEKTIGAIGSTGRSTGPHLHYEIHFKGERINPELYFNF
ncbi:peptidoglycan DD-metalloendopeptidase family protein [Chryseobacterium sp. CT-SW4]|uniref:peptidoglycan DD-metalloendopeptidase family protein n=1 Tax=Chryseobacterium sp. SW-1 TaxID=3157343 RepID=UPI003B0228A5